MCMVVTLKLVCPGHLTGKAPCCPLRMTSTGNMTHMFPGRETRAWLFNCCSASEGAASPLAIAKQGPGERAKRRD